MNCLICSKQLHRGNKYCSIECQKIDQYNKYIERWKTGEESGLKGKYQISNYIVKYLFEKYDNKCAICGWSKLNSYTNKIPLEVEHLDGNYLNNFEENLILLCPNCHSLTATYKGANKGRGRKMREKYSLYANPELDSEKNRV